MTHDFKDDFYIETVDMDSADRKENSRKFKGGIY